MRQAQCMEAQTFHILVQDCPKYVDNCAIIETWCRELGGNVVRNHGAYLDPTKVSKGR